MTLAVFTPTDAHVHKRAPRRHRSFALAAWLFGTLALLASMLVALPDGLAEPLQTLIGWSIVGMAAAAAVLAVVKGLERLLDCETS